MGSGDRRNGGAWACGCRKPCGRGREPCGARSRRAARRGRHPQIPLWRRYDQYCRRPVVPNRHRSHDGRPPGTPRRDRHPRQQRRGPPLCRGGEFLAGTMGRGAGGQSVRALPPRASCFARHEAARLWPYHQHGLDLFDAGGCGTDRLRHHENRDHRHDARHCHRNGNDEYHLQCAVSGHAADAGHPVEDRNRGRTGMAAPSTRPRGNIWRRVSRADGSSRRKASAP